VITFAFIPAASFFFLVFIFVRIFFMPFSDVDRDPIADWLCRSWAA